MLSTVNTRKSVTIVLHFDNYSHYSSSHYKSCRSLIKMFVVLIEPVGSGDCDGGILETIDQGYGKEYNLNSG